MAKEPRRPKPAITAVPSNDALVHRLRDFIPQIQQANDNLPATLATGADQFEEPA